MISTGGPLRTGGGTTPPSPARIERTVFNVNAQGIKRTLRPDDRINLVLGARLTTNEEIAGHSSYGINASIYSENGQWYFETSLGSKLIGKIQLDQEGSPLVVGRGQPSDSNSLVFPDTDDFNHISRGHLQISLLKAANGEAAVSLRERPERATQGVSCVEFKQTRPAQPMARSDVPAPLAALTLGQGSMYLSRDALARQAPFELILAGEKYLIRQEGIIYYIKKTSAEKEGAFFSTAKESVFTPFQWVRVISTSHGFTFEMNAQSREEIIARRNNRTIPPPTPAIDDQYLRTFCWAKYTPILPAIADTETGEKVASVDLEQLASQGGGIVYVTCKHRAAVYTIEVNKDGQVLIFHFTPLSRRDYDQGKPDNPYYTRLSANPFRHIVLGPEPTIKSLNGRLTKGEEVTWPYFDGGRNESWTDRIQTITILHRKHA